MYADSIFFVIQGHLRITEFPDYRGGFLEGRYELVFVLQPIEIRAKLILCLHNLGRSSLCFEAADLPFQNELFLFEKFGSIQIVLLFDLPLVFTNGLDFLSHNHPNLVPVVNCDRNFFVRQSR